jgi:peptidoglycan/LPS O-acetylase OafA/YrhL
MHPSLLFAANLLATTASDSQHFSIGPWIIVPILMVAALVAVPVYIVRDRRKRRELESEWSRTDRRYDK